MTFFYGAFIGAYFYPKMYEALIYGNINQYSARDFINGINAAKTKSVKVRVNSDGGEIRSGWGMLSKLSEMESVEMINDGEANSMAGLAFFYAGKTSCITEATFGLHRAGYFDETDMSAEDVEYLTATNKKLRAQAEKKVSPEKFFKASKGLTYDQFFSLAGRPMVMINAKEALECGLVDEIIDIDMTAKAEINNRTKIAIAKYSESEIGKQKAAATSPLITKPMTSQELQREHPAVYAEIFKAGQDDQFDKSAAALAFIDIDKKGAIEAFNSRKLLGAKEMAEFSVKAMASAQKTALETESTKEVKTDEGGEQKEKTKAEALVAAAMANSSYFKQAAK